MTVYLYIYLVSGAKSKAIQQVPTKGFAKPDFAIFERKVSAK